MDLATRKVLERFAADGVGVEGPVVESWWRFYRRFRSLLPGVEDRRHVDPIRAYVSKSTSQLGLREWRRKLRRNGYRAVWGDRSGGGRALALECPDLCLVYRLAPDWRVGLSWAMDPRRCESTVPAVTGAPVSATLWAAVVPASEVLAHYWQARGRNRASSPLWKTVDTEWGPVAVAEDDWCEVLIDPGNLSEGDVFAPGVVVAVHQFDEVSRDVEYESFNMLLAAAQNWRQHPAANRGR